MTSTSRLARCNGLSRNCALAPAASRAQRGHRRGQRQGGHHRPPVHRGVVQRRSRRCPAVDVGHGDQSMTGYPHIVDDDIIGAGGAHSGGVPHILDADVSRRQQHQGRIRRVVRPADSADEHPVGIHDPGRPRPSPGQPDPAVDRCAASGRRERRGAQSSHRGPLPYLLVWKLSAAASPRGIPRGVRQPAD